MRNVTYAIVLFTLSAWHLPAHSSDSEAAAERLLKLMNMDNVFDQMVEQSLAAQLAQNPQLAQFREVMLEFLNKHLSWQSLKPEMVAVYAETFTTDELGEISAFYETPTGQKALQKMPELFSKGAQIGMRRVQENIPELQAMLREAAEKNSQ